MTTLGFVGLGHMGGNMAVRFLGAGYAVYGETRQRAAGYEHRDIAALFEVLAHLTSDATRPPT